MVKAIPTNGPKKPEGVETLIIEKINLKAILIRRYKEGH